MMELGMCMHCTSLLLVPFRAIAEPVPNCNNFCCKECIPATLMYCKFCSILPRWTNAIFHCSVSVIQLIKHCA